MSLIAEIVTGSIFHASCPNGASLICLSTSVTNSIIFARSLTTHISYEFNRATGIAYWGENKVPCKIDSVDPLPAKIHNLMLQIDFKFAPHNTKDESSLKLTNEEIQALLLLMIITKQNLLNKYLNFKRG